tara:strand:+ start:1384 stop:1530 length:147 start_codon:yes stop_codon:yes gene_type:complete
LSDLDDFLKEIGLTGRSIEVKKDKVYYPDMLDKSYFNDPRDQNGEVPF